MVPSSTKVEDSGQGTDFSNLPLSHPLACVGLGEGMGR